MKISEIEEFFKEGGNYAKEICERDQSEEFTVMQILITRTGFDICCSTEINGPENKWARVGILNTAAHIAMSETVRREGEPGPGATVIPLSSLLGALMGKGMMTIPNRMCRAQRAV